MTASNDIFKAIVADTSPFIIKGGWFPSISLTVRDRAILSKFSTHRVSEKYTRKYFSLLKNDGHFAFSNFCQKW